MHIANVREFFKRYPDDETCLAHLFDTRYGQGHVCPKCERESKWYPIKAEKAFSCQFCGHHIHPMAGTIFERSRTPLQLWFYAIYLFTTTRHGVSGKELQRQLGVTYKTAHRMGHKIREHMAAVDGEDPIGGNGEVVEIDEAYVGGRSTGKRGRGAHGKTIVLGMVERGDDGEAIIKVIPNTDRKTVQDVIVASVAKGSEVHTDMHQAYDNLDKRGYTAKRINKRESGLYVGPNGETVNAVENFWRHLKCSIKGTHNNVSKKYLERYAKEFEYRFNRRVTPDAMLGELLTRFPELSAE
ncbi:IS1595 family transposase [Henriciella pelagia]|uniref:IS1595 family transposase n=1 Tax=Henriciella pelagia TaxID=1977912 RepID=UPI0035196DCC